MSNEQDKKSDQKRYLLDGVKRDASIDRNCRRNGDSYGTWFGAPARTRYFCKTCYRVGNDMKHCPTCCSDTVILDQRARVPRKDASKAKWKKFFANFFPDLLDRE